MGAMRAVKEAEHDLVDVTRGTIISAARAVGRSAPQPGDVLATIVRGVMLGAYDVDSDVSLAAYAYAALDASREVVSELELGEDEAADQAVEGIMDAVVKGGRMGLLEKLRLSLWPTGHKMA